MVASFKDVSRYKHRVVSVPQMPATAKFVLCFLEIRHAKKEKMIKVLIFYFECVIIKLSHKLNNQRLRMFLYFKNQPFICVQIAKFVKNADPCDLVCRLNSRSDSFV